MEGVQGAMNGGMDMNTLSVKRLGFAFGTTSALLYAGCALVMSILPRDSALRFFNSLTHGVDWGPIMRWEMPLWEMAIGIIEIFILGWLVGAAIAAFYNLTGRPTRI